jgi:hypothetical protein
MQSTKIMKSILTTSLVSQKPVPLTIIKGAGHEYIPIPEGESAIVADFHSYVALPYSSSHMMAIPSFHRRGRSITSPSDSSKASELKPPTPQPT